MKYLLTVLLVVTLGTAVMAQVRFGLEAGANIATIKVKEDPPSGYSPSYSSKVGFKIGALADIGIGDHLAVQPGVFYSMRGGKIKVDVPGFGSAETERTVNYLEVPILVQYKLNAGPGRVFVGLGPSVGMGLSGKDHEKYNYAFFGSKDTTVSVKFGSDTTETKKMDFGAVFNVGYELNMGVFVRVSYYLGLANMANNGPGQNDKATNRGFSVSAGYLLGRRNSQY
jgi:hypothetical protein